MQTDNVMPPLEYISVVDEEESSPHPIYWNDRKPKFSDVVIGFGALFAGLFITIVVSIVGFVAFPDDVGMLASFSQSLGTFTMGLVLWLVLRARKWTKSDLGLLPLGRKGWHLLWEVPLMFVTAAGISAGIRAIVPIEDAPDGMEDIAGAASPWIVLALVVYVVAGPFVEEIIFRRLLMGWLDYKVGVVVSTVLTCVIFAVFHFSPAAIIWVGVMGLFVALSVRWHNSIWAGYVIHVVNNLLASLVLVSALF